MSNYLNQERNLEQALLTKKKWEDIIDGKDPYPCKHCKQKKLPKEFVIQYIDNQLVGKYRYLYECKQCKRERIYKVREDSRATIEGALEIVFKHLLQGAKKRKLEFSITYNNLKALRDKQKGRCYYSGYDMQFEFVGFKPGSRTEKAKMQVSCDRLDNNVGYSVENIVLCCTFINQMKGSLSEQEFYTVCRDIGKHASKK